KFSTYAALSPLIMILWNIVFSSLRVYEARRMLRRTHEVQLILKAHGIAMLLFIAMTYMFSEYKYSRAVMIYFGVAGGIALVTFRLSLRNLLRALRRNGYNLRYVLLAGEGDAVETLIRRIEKFPELGLRISGVVTQAASQTKEILGKKVIGHFADISKLIRERGIDQILIALPRNQTAELDGILVMLKDETVRIQLVPDVHEYVTLGCEIEDFDGLPIVNLNDSPLSGWGAVAKRLTDILVSSLALALLFVPMILIAAAVRLSSRGSVFYKQERMGLDGRTFHMLKFRSMHDGAENETGAVWANAQDSRRTWLGSFLRSTSLDELPQFWNVLRGEMSLVGPRPERPVFVRQFRSEIP
ncbi:MAG: exopolysaccharide biosynthesis polyprenyl glycosylphosphotransferase, partial [Bdellovibrionota bacterium]